MPQLKSRNLFISHLVARPSRGAAMLGLGIAVTVGPPVAVVEAQPGAVRMLTVTEQWRTDATPAGEGFAQPRGVVVLPNGDAWVLDGKDLRIYRFDARGRALPPVGRSGAGPGEMRAVNGMLVHPDGEVWVNDHGNRRINVYGADGAFRRQFPSTSGGYGWAWDGWVDSATRRVLERRYSPGAGGTIGAQWQALDGEGKAIETLDIPSCAAGAPGTTGFKAETKGKGQMFGSYPFTIGGGVAPDGRGGIWCAGPQSSRVARLRAGRGDTTAATSLTLAAPPVTAVERAAAVDRIRRQLASYEVTDFDPARIPSRKPPILGLAVDGDARLWVRHTVADGARAVFDLHDRSGVHLGRIMLPGRVPQGGWYFGARGDDLWVIMVDEDDVPSLARFRLGR
jgi:streptogramin lyase